MILKYTVFVFREPSGRAAFGFVKLKNISRAADAVWDGCAIVEK